MNTIETVDTVVVSAISPIWLWFGYALICAILEIFLPSFFMIFLAVAAIFPIVVALFGGDFYWQLALYGLALVIVFLLLRPLVTKRFQNKSKDLSRMEQLLGKIGHLSEPISGPGLNGRVMVDGQDWAASSVQALAAGAAVKIVCYDGLILKVEAR